ncbi:MAG: hypothetical protein AABX13_05295 [Nanoarchaeota archaeon]
MEEDQLNEIKLKEDQFNNRVNIKSQVKGKIASLTSSLSGSLSFLGGYQVCHNVCLGIVALLSLVGITVVGMPLLFLQKVAVPFWIAAVVLFGITLGIYVKMRCLSRNLLLLNGGIIVASVPFYSVKPVLPLLWIAGGAIVIVSILLMVKARLHKSQ